MNDICELCDQFSRFSCIGVQDQCKEKMSEIDKILTSAQANMANVNSCLLRQIDIKYQLNNG